MTESYSAISTVQLYYTNEVREGPQLPFNFDLMKQVHAENNAHDIVNAVNSWLDPMPAGHFTNWVVSIWKEIVKEETEIMMAQGSELEWGKRESICSML